LGGGKVAAREEGGSPTGEIGAGQLSQDGREASTPEDIHEFN